MEVKDCYYLGYISKTFGYKGEVVCYLDVDDPEYYEKLESVFIHLEGKLVPFFIDKITFRPTDNEAVIAFEHVDTEEKALHICGNEMYLPLEKLPALSGNQFYFHEITGFLVIDAEKGPVGRVEQVLEFPGNPVLQLKKGNKEVLVPASDEIIEKIDREKKEIRIHAPDGLIDLYLAE